MLVNDAAKLYGNLAKDLLDEILSKYDITISRSLFTINIANKPRLSLKTYLMSTNL